MLFTITIIVVIENGTSKTTLLAEEIEYPFCHNNSGVYDLFQALSVRLDVPGRLVWQGPPDFLVLLVQQVSLALRVVEEWLDPWDPLASQALVGVMVSLVSRVSMSSLKIFYRVLNTWFNEPILI